MFESTTNIVGTDAGTPLDYASPVGDFDTSIPTFDITAGADMKIAKAGLYQISHYPYNVGRGTGESVCEIDIWTLKTGGGIPGGWHPWSGGGSIYDSQVPVLEAAGTSIYFSNGRYHPTWQDFFTISDSQITGSGPLEMTTYMKILKDQGSVDDHDVICKTTIVRLGMYWVDP